MSIDLFDGIDAKEMYDAYRFLADEANRMSEAMDPVNTVVAGGTGVGKSTLINSIFGRPLAKVGIGEPQTMKIERLSVPDLPLTIYDTRGLEIADAAATISELRSFIEQLRQSVEFRNQIHIVCLCILEETRRIEPIHKLLLQLLRDYRIPTIVVLTKSKEDTDFLAVVRRELKGAQAVIQVHSVPLRTARVTIDVDQCLRDRRDAGGGAGAGVVRQGWASQFRAGCALRGARLPRRRSPRQWRCQDGQSRL